MSPAASLGRLPEGPPLAVAIPPSPAILQPNILYCNEAFWENESTLGSAAWEGRTACCSLGGYRLSAPCVNSSGDTIVPKAEGYPDYSDKMPGCGEERLLMGKNRHGVGSFVFGVRKFEGKAKCDNLVWCIAKSGRVKRAPLQLVLRKLRKAL